MSSTAKGPEDPRLPGEDSSLDAHPVQSPEGLYFFPEDVVTEEELVRILAEGPTARRAWVVSHLLRYAVWDDIWSYVSRDDVREIFADLDLPENLRAAWGRMLKVETPVA